MNTSNDNQTSKSEATERAAQKPSAGMSRRQLLRAGIATAPVVLTLASRPVLAGGNLQCVSPSAFASLQANAVVSQHGTTPVVCAGRSPGYWKNHTGGWPSPFVSKTTPHKTATLFQSFTTGFDGDVFSADFTILDVLEDDGGGQIAVGRHVAAALLNAASGNVSMPDATAVAHIWNEFVQYGYYTPTAGVEWDGKEIIAYLTNSMG